MEFEGNRTQVSQAANRAQHSAESSTPVGESATPSDSLLRTLRVVHAAVLLAVGFVIAFTATIHENVASNRWIIAASLLAIGAATLLVYWAQRNLGGSWPVAARAAAMIAAGGALLVVQGQLELAVVVILWALVNAVLIDASAATKLETRRETLPGTLLSIALGVAIFMFREDPVAVIGFFGAYTTIAGVFLGISAFDRRAEGLTNAEISENKTAESAEIEGAR